MINNAVSIVRILVAAAITGLTALVTYEPTWVWIPAVVAALGVIATHVIPSVGQVPAVKSNTGYTLTQPQDVYPYTTDKTGGESGHTP